MLELNDRWYKAFEIIERCFFPKHCALCDEIIPINEAYCKCITHENIKIGDDFCVHCGYDSHRCVCSAENSVSLPYVAGVYLYSGKVKADILDLKFSNEPRIAIRLGTDMAERCAKVYCDVDFDAVTYIPMTKEAVNERFYNQAKLLANQVGKLLFVPVEDMLVKTKSTHKQHTLNGKERLSNVKDSVAIKDAAKIKGKRILICDDVKTTGATLYECVSLLKKAEAAEVYCICAALSDFSKQ